MQMQNLQLSIYYIRNVAILRVFRLSLKRGLQSISSPFTSVKTLIIPPFHGSQLSVLEGNEENVPFITFLTSKI